MECKKTEVCGIEKSWEEISAEPSAEWRSLEQVENGITSTSPSLWDTDDECGPKPSELYGTFTWKIDKFSQINKRELRSEAFEVGGYKWYILIYPQGCDVCNHLSLFLCVANHDKLFPGWSQFAQFTITVENKDPKDSKYSDTLHRFWKKEHDWGWKKFMELSKVLDGFVDADTLIIKAQVQVIRERADRPFRCLDCEYRRELVRVYLTNVEQICRRFVEERRGRLRKLIEDKARWSSFCAFWLGTDQNTRHRMSKEKTEVILKVVVKHFFIEKEVTSTLVMDSLYSGLKALEGWTKTKNASSKLLKTEGKPVPIVRVEKDMFVLVDDVLLLLERAAVEPLPPKDEKGPRYRIKDGGCGEDFYDESIERDERHLTELGRRTIEIFVLAHIFSKIEVAYQEAVSLKRQEELIREEEAAWLAETVQKAKCRASEKEKKSKKKQGKQKRNKCKGKDKRRVEKNGVSVHDYHQESHGDEGKDFFAGLVEPVLEKANIVEDVSDTSDSVDCVPDGVQIDSDDKDASPINCDTDTSEVHPPTEASSCGISGISSVQNGGERKSPSLIDDSSSTCSTDSVPSVVMNGPYKWNSVPNKKGQKSPSRRRNQRGKGTYDGTDWGDETHNRPSSGAADAGKPHEAIALSLQDQIKPLEQHVVKKETLSSRRKPSIQDRTEVERSSKELPKAVPTSLWSVSGTKPCPNIPQKTDKASSLTNPTEITALSAPDVQKALTPKPTEKKPLSHQVPSVSRPFGAPLVPGPKATAPVDSIVRTTQLLARSVTSARRSGPDPSSSSTHSYVPPRSYRNAIVGHSVSASSVPNLSTYRSEPSIYISTPIISQSSERVDMNSTRPGFSSGTVSHDAVQNGSQSMECPPNRDLHTQDQFPGRPTQVVSADEFPHLDIINDLLNEEQGAVGESSSGFGSFNNGPHYLNRQFSLPGDIGMSSEVGPTARSCRFDRSRSYHDDGYLYGCYPSTGGPFESLRPTNQLPYFNGRIDGLMTNQWQIGGSDPSFLSTRHRTEGDGDPYYQIPEACGINGYSVFGPSNGY